MTDLRELERAVLRMLVAGDHPSLTELRDQLGHVQVSSREETGVGFYSHLEVAGCVPSSERDFDLGDVHAKMEGLQHGAGFVLFIRGGLLNLLEGFTYDEPWPESVGAFSLEYTDPARSSVLERLRQP